MSHTSVNCPLRLKKIILFLYHLINQISCVTINEHLSSVQMTSKTATNKNIWICQEFFPNNTSIGMKNNLEKNSLMNRNSNNYTNNNFTSLSLFYFESTNCSLKNSNNTFNGTTYVFENVLAMGHVIQEMFLLNVLSYYDDSNNKYNISIDNVVVPYALNSGYDYDYWTWTRYFIQLIFRTSTTLLMTKPPRLWFQVSEALNLIISQ